MDNTQLKPLISSLVEINELVRRQSEERTAILGNLFEALEKYIKKNEGNVQLLDQAVSQIHEIHTHISPIEEKETNEKDRKMLKSINRLLANLDMMENERKELADKKVEINKDIMDRDELIGILSEYVDLGFAQNYKFLSEISELQAVKDQYTRNIELYTQLSQFDPRIQAVSILEKHPNGISSFQMMRMLDISSYEARRIINELIDLGMIFRREGSDILHYKMNPIILESITR